VPAEERYAKPLHLEPGRLYRSTDEPIRIGTMLWVYTEPHQGHEFAYNRWYERDHYYANGMIGQNEFAGSRWVATRRHKDARFPVETAPPFPPRNEGSYACVYFILAGQHEAWLEWGTPAAHELYAADRGFQARTHYNTGTYRHDWRAYRDPDPVPLELALDHEYPGLVAQFIEASAGADASAIDAWFERELPAWLDGSPVASVSSWSSIPLPDTKPTFLLEDPGAAPLQLYLYEEDPLLTWDRQRDLATRFERSGLGRILFTAPFVATVVGTDTYVDELW
jgi:hypothetical protein